MSKQTFLGIQDRSWVDWEDLDYQKAAAAEELTRAQNEITQLHEDKALLEAKVSQLTGAFRSLGHDPTDFAVGVSSGFARTRNINSPTLANTINATWLSPQHHGNTMHGDKGTVGVVSTGGARSGAAGPTSVNSSRSGFTRGTATTTGAAGSRANKLQQLQPESLSRSHTQQGGTQNRAQAAACLATSLPGGISYAELFSENTTKESLPQNGGIMSSHNSSDPPDPAEYAPPFTTWNPGST